MNIVSKDAQGVIRVQQFDNKVNIQNIVFAYLLINIPTEAAPQ